MKHKQVLVLKAQFGKHIWHMLWAVYNFLSVAVYFTFSLKAEGARLCWWCTAPLIFFFSGLLLPSIVTETRGRNQQQNPAHNNAKKEHYNTDYKESIKLGCKPFPFRSLFPFVKSFKVASVMDAAQWRCPLPCRLLCLQRFVFQVCIVLQIAQLINFPRWVISMLV